MAANVETMFSVREKPWHGLGTIVAEAPDSGSALELAGLDWNVIQKSIVTADGTEIEGFKANVRDSDNSVLGIVTDRYKVVQNRDAFSFTDALLGEGVKYETAGALQGGRRTWMLAKLPHQYIIGGDEISPYLVFMNSHDGAGAIKVAITPIRVVCQNTLNMALETAKRSWSCNHIGDIEDKMEEARNTLLYANRYMVELGKSIDTMQQIKLSDKKVYEFLDELFPIGEDATRQQRKNIMKMKEHVKARYYDAPDLQHVGHNAYRFVNAVSDFCTHAKPLRERANYKENLFARTVEGIPMMDKAYRMVLSAA